MQIGETNEFDDRRCVNRRIDVQRPV
jgi:hypothetical protein